MTILIHCRSVKAESKTDMQQPNSYQLDEQIGFILRKASQRHAAIFASDIVGDLTPTQFAAMAKLYEVGECSQNHLGRRVAMDAATIKGVIDRLSVRGYVETWPDPKDRRRLRVDLTARGKALAEQAIPSAIAITHRTLDPLSPSEQTTLLRLLTKLT